MTVPTEPPCGYATLHVYDRDGTTFRDELEVTGLTWTDPLGQEGSVTFSASLRQRAVQERPDLLEDAMVKIAVPLAFGAAPTDIMAALTRPGRGVAVVDSEDAGNVESFTCPGLLSVLDDWVIDPDGGFRPNAADERYFGYMSRGFDDSTWTAPESALADPVLFGDDEFTYLDRGVRLIGVSNPGAPGEFGDDFLARSTFTVAAGQERVRIYATADDYLEMYLDSELIFTSRQEGVELRDVKSHTADLAPGEHTLAARVTNGAFSGTNQTWLKCVVARLDDEGNPGRVIRRTDAENWVVHPNTPVQGESAARILRRLLDEAVSRGIPSADRISPSFTNTTATDGATWPDLQQRAFRVGEEGYAGFVGKVADLAFDLDMRPDWTLDAYLAQGDDRTADVVLGVGDNVVEHVWQGRGVIATRLRVRTADGWVQVIDTAAEAAGVEARERTVESGYTYDVEGGQAIAEASLGELARLRRTYATTLTAVEGAVPYLDFGKGDLVTAPNHLEAMVPMQVVSINGSRPDTPGAVGWVLELVEV